MAAALSLHGSKLVAKRSMCVLAPISDFWDTERMRSGAPYYDVKTETYHMFYQVRQVVRHTKGEGRILISVLVLVSPTTRSVGQHLLGACDKQEHDNLDRCAC
jgi:hypothetical protein